MTMTMTDTYDRGEQQRQAILDLLREHGPLGVTEIAALTGASVPTAHKRVFAMHNMQELTRVGGPRFKYLAAVEKTRAAQIFRDRRTANYAEFINAKRKREAALERCSTTSVDGPVTTHICSNCLPTPKGYGGGQARSRIANGFSPISVLVD